MLAAIKADARGAEENEGVLHDEEHGFSGAVVGNGRCIRLLQVFNSKECVSEGWKGKKEGKSTEAANNEASAEPDFCFNHFGGVQGSGDYKEEEAGDCCW